MHLPGTGLDTKDWKHHASMLSSKQVASRRPHISDVTIDGAQLDAASLGVLFCHTSIETLHVKCLTPYAIRQLGMLLQEHRSTLNLASMVFQGSHLPPCLPLTLQALELTLAGWGSQDWQWKHLCESLDINGITLRCLTIDMGIYPPVRSRVELPALQELCIKFNFSREMYVYGFRPDLVGLADHCKARISIDISIGSSILSEHTQVLSEVQSVPMRELCMHFCCPFRRSMQRLWQNLQLTAPLHIHLQGQPGIDPLEALPASPMLHIHVNAMHFGKPMHIQWTALVSNPGAIQIDMTQCEPACTLAVLGYTGQVPFQAADRPWQLCVLGNVHLEGLPVSHACTPARYLLQNRAAAAAGWTEVS